MRTLRLVIQWGIPLVVISAAALFVYVYSQINDQVRLRAIAELQKLLPGLEVSVGNAELIDSSKGVVIRKVVIFQPKNHEKNIQLRRKLIEIDEISLNCPISLTKIVNDEIVIQSVEIIGPHIFLSRDENGNIREKELLINVESKKNRFPVYIQKGCVELDGVCLNNINLELLPEKEPDIQPQNELNELNVMTAGGNQNKNRIIQTSAKGLDNNRLENSGSELISQAKETDAGNATQWWSFSGTANTEWCKLLQFSGSFEKSSQNFTVNGSVIDLRCCESFWDFAKTFKKRTEQTESYSKVPAVHSASSNYGVQKKKAFDLDKLISSVRGRADADFTISSDKSAKYGVRANIEGTLRDGKAEVNFLKRPITEVALQFYFSDEEIRISNCSGNYGDSQLAFLYHQPSLLNIENTTIRIKATEFLADKDIIWRLSPFLPQMVNKFFDKFKSISAYVDLETTLIRSGNRWVPQSLELLGYDLCYTINGSTLTVDGLTGKLSLDSNERLTFLFQTPNTEVELPEFDISVASDFSANSANSDISANSEFPANSPDQRGRLRSNSSRLTQGNLSGNNISGNRSTNLKNLPSWGTFSNQYPAPERRLVHSITNSTGPTSVDNSPNKSKMPYRKQSQNIRIEGVFGQLFTSLAGNVELRASGIPIDSNLINLIPDNSRKVIESLHPKGSISVYANFDIKKNNTKDDTVDIQKKIVIRAEDCAVQYDHFPYPVSAVNGIIEWDGTNWLFRNFSGSNESTSVTANGSLKLYPEGYLLTLIFGVSDLPLEGRLNDALLNPSYKEIHRSIQGTGRVNVNAQVLYYPTLKHLKVSFDAKPIKKDGITIRPQIFPFKIEIADGEFHFEDGVFTAKNMRGKNKETQFTSNIGCSFNQNGSWEMLISDLHIDQLQPQDNELLKAMPDSLKAISKYLKPEGLINIDGNIKFTKQNQFSPLRSEWDMSITTHQNNVEIGLPVKNIFGRIHLKGINDEFGANKVYGNLEVDSAFIKNVQISDIRGPFFFDGSQVLFGQDVVSAYNLPVERGKTAPPISATMFGGAAYSRGAVFMGQKNLSYDLQLDLVDADLSTTIQELQTTTGVDSQQGVRNISGKLSISTNLHGEGRNLDTVTGEGTIAIRNAYLYESPMMLKILQILSIREPNKSAFDSSDVKFRVQGKKILLNNVKFDGSAFSLEGSGDLLLDSSRRVNLVFKTKLGGTRNRIPIFTDLIGGAGDQFNEIRVDGTLDNPQIKRITLPAMRNAIEQMQGE
ncbi:MAG: AsmA-like C-terminal domain-containing protein [Thermoguttaceae bacterium]